MSEPHWVSSRAKLRAPGASGLEDQFKGNAEKHFLTYFIRCPKLDFRHALIKTDPQNPATTSCA